LLLQRKTPRSWINTICRQLVAAKLSESAEKFNDAKYVVSVDHNKSV
jgi:hypothetical protein